MLTYRELQNLTMEELEFERNRAECRVDGLRIMLACDAQLKRDAMAAAVRYLLMIEREIERREGGRKEDNGK